MSNALSPIVSEFETEEQAASYDRWFRAKVQASLDDSRPSIPHDQAMALIREKLVAKLAHQDAMIAKSRSRDA
ncbi:stability determinant [Castellaniella sp. MT123]|uniref:type II toxin-antitoxin system RelB family antitoxin n=1 Tax=Castellaniella sp. MT123 TaxID=3140381 RepID=UPI0031F3865D